MSAICAFKKKKNGSFEDWEDGTWGKHLLFTTDLRSDPKQGKLDVVVHMLPNMPIVRWEVTMAEYWGFNLWATGLAYTAADRGPCLRPGGGQGLPSEDIL